MGNIRKNRFIVLCFAVLLILLSGAMIKHTLLGQIRSDAIWPYPVRYEILVTDACSPSTDMFFEGMGLYLEDYTAAGTVTKVARQPAMSGAADCEDLTLTVEAMAAGSTSRKVPFGKTGLEDEVTFVNRFITFSGRITRIEGE
ncbi:MAG: hypothetical protein IJ206_07570 [Oscillospiraceae bacterium]|nr:hypothetical protein [Oscillospiraceae bacterium]